MDPKRIVALVVGAAVMVLIFSALLVPIINDATTTEKTFTNEGAFNYGKFTPTDTYELTYTASDGKITANGDVVTPISGVSLTNYGSYSVIASDNVLLRYGSNQSGYYMQLIGNDSGGNNVLTGGVSGTATITGGQLSVTLTSSEDVTTTKTFNFTELYAIVADEDVAVMKVSTTPVYIKGDSELYGSGLTTVSSWNNMFHFEGTYDDGITITSPNLTTATFDNIEWNIEPVSGYEDLYKLTSIEFDITNSDTTVHATYSYFAVPSEVTAELSVHPDAPTLSLLSVIPIIVMIGIVLAVVGVAIVSRNDY